MHCPEQQFHWLHVSRRSASFVLVLHTNSEANIHNTQGKSILPHCVLSKIYGQIFPLKNNFTACVHNRLRCFVCHDISEPKLN